MSVPILLHTEEVIGSSPVSLTTHIHPEVSTGPCHPAGVANPRSLA